MYVLAENLTEGIDGIQVTNLTENQTGCLHDYQLTTSDMKLIDEADAFIINGAGLETFLEKVYIVVYTINKILWIMCHCEAP